MRCDTDEIHPGLSYFGDVFLGMQHLAEVDFSDNALNLDGAKSIVPLLEGCLSLKKLRLNNTGVGPFGGQFIGNALIQAVDTAAKLGKSYGLTQFVLGRSRLQLEGTKTIAQ